MSILYIVATPIGNLQDITLRALETLKQVDLIACEDTRQTKKILTRYHFSKPLVSYHQHSRLTKLNYLIDKLKSGQTVALVSDAGTPGISDPGYVLIAEAIKNKIKVVPIPGPSALITALSASGLPTHNFIFLGFIPHKKGRSSLLSSLASEKRTAIFYESPHRIQKTLSQLKEILDKDRKIALARELTKIYEEFLRGTVDEVMEKLTPDKVRGEFVVMIEGSTRKS